MPFPAVHSHIYENQEKRLHIVSSLELRWCVKAVFHRGLLLFACFVLFCFFNFKIRFSTIMVPKGDYAELLFKSNFKHYKFYSSLNRAFDAVQATFQPRWSLFGPL